MAYSNTTISIVLFEFTVCQIIVNSNCIVHFYDTHLNLVPLDFLMATLILFKIKTNYCEKDSFYILVNYSN